ncbi:calpastatin isoform X4 [Brienomyrus brachyistius]|uniref:calpastatin isoform X4 n=1 Tax=Brienomyrus brachyistius TaxID=42636 RepID=UPI0020B34A94|nr:calpastatin isoform X4 [Brienomyrus brachyistius]
MSQPKQTASTSASQVAGAKPAAPETSSGSPSKATPLTSPTGKAGAASTAGPGDVGPAKGKQEGVKPQDTAQVMPKSVPTSSKKAESVDPTKPVVAAGAASAVAAGGVSTSASAGKAAVEGKMEVKSKDAPIASTKAVAAQPAVTKASAEVKQRSQEAKPTKTPENPKKPLSTDAALDSLSAGFDSSAAQSKEKKKPVVEDIGAVDVLSATLSNVSPSPADSQATQKKAESKKPAVGSVSKSEAPPADKKARMHKDAGLAAPKPSGDQKTKKEEDTSMSADALSALEDLLPSAEPEPEPPKVQPKDIVTEDKLKSEKGVRVGEREDSLPPEYRFTEDKLKEYPVPKKEPSMDSGEALDILCGDFVSPVAAPEPPKQAKKDAHALDVLAEDFVAPAKAPSVQAPVLPSSHVPQQKDPQPSSTSTAAGSKSVEDTSMSADALSALEDLLPSAEPEPEPPKVQPKDIVTEDKLKSEKGVRVGEREDSLPPEYRFSEDKLKEYPVPKKEPSMDSGEALDILCGDFVSPVAAPEPPKQAKKDAHALDVLAEDFVAPAKAPSVQAPVLPSSHVPQQDTSMSADALSALEDLLPSAEPEPEPPKVQPKDIVTEDKLKSEKGVRVGEREDSLPPEYRFTEDKLKEYPVPKKEPSIDDATALGLLCSDFDAPAAPTAPAAPAAPAPVTKATPTAAAPKVTSTTTPAVQSSAKAKVKAPSVEPTQKTSLDFEDVVTPGVAPVVQAATAQPPAAERQLSEGTASALDALSDTLTDDTPAPAPTPVPAKNIVKEKTAIEEKAVKTGERDDSLPPEYRPSEKDALAKKDVKHVAPKQPSLDDATALGLLSSDFDAPTAPAAPAASALVTKATPTAAAPKVTSTTTPAVQSSEKAKVKAPSVEPTQKATDAVMDALSSTLLPDNPAFKSKAVPTDEKAQATSSSSKSKPKKPKVSDSPAPDDLSAQSHSDVVASPATKKGSKS